MPEAPLSLQVVPGSDHARVFMADPDTIPEGVWSFEERLDLANSWRSADGEGAVSASSYQRINLMTVEVRRGLYPALDAGITLGLSTQYADVPYTDGVGVSQPGPREGKGLQDSLFALRWRALGQETWPLTASLISAAGFPTAPASDGSVLGIGEDCPFWQNTLALAYDKGDLGFQGQVEQRARVSDRRGDRLGDISAQFALAYSLAPQVQVSAGGGYRQELFDDIKGSDLYNLSLDALWHPVPSTRLGLGLQWGLAGHDSTLPVHLGLKVSTLY
jgi:hypothetical protein